MLYRFAKNYGARSAGEIIDVTPDAALDLVAEGVLVCIEPDEPPPGPQDRAMQPPPRGKGLR